MDHNTDDDLSHIREAAALVLAEMQAHPGTEIALLTDAFLACGGAAARQGLAAVLAEREACAKVAETQKDRDAADASVSMVPQDWMTGAGAVAAATQIAAAIRARKDRAP